MYTRPLALAFFILGSVLATQAQTLVLKNIGAVTPLAWGDYDNDGDMDLLQYDGSALRILKNTVVGTTATFADAGISLVGFNPSQSGWVDFNADGYLDIFYIESGALKLFVSQKGTSFVMQTVAGESVSSIADWGDIDNDGDLDILGYGAIFRNIGNSRIQRTQSLGSSARSEFLDFDNDGDLDFYSSDLLYTNKGDGLFELNKTLSPYGTSTGYTYRDFVFFYNDAGGDKKFVNSYEYEPLSSFSTLLWDFEYCGGGGGPITPLKYLALADFDNDGKKDVLIQENTLINLYTSTQSCVTLASLSVPAGRVGISDFDNDGDLDVFIGNNVYENKTTTLNGAPATPGNLTVTSTKPSLKLSWSPATDDKTAAANLTYNVIIKRGPDVVVTRNVSTSGTRMLTQPGNAQFNTSIQVRDLPKGKYTWAVQSVDAAFKTSTLSSAQSFELDSGRDVASLLPVQVSYSSVYNETTDRYLLTYIKSNTELMGLFVDGKAVQAIGSEFKINTTTGSTIRNQVVGCNPVKNEFVVSWSEENGATKKIYVKNILSSGPNTHAEHTLLSRTDTLKIFLAGDKIVSDPGTGKYIIPWMQNRTDVSTPSYRFNGMEVYYPNSFLDVYAANVSTSGTSLTHEPARLLQTKTVPVEFHRAGTINYGVQSANDFSTWKKLYALSWSFLGERRTVFGSGSSNDITNILKDDAIKLVVTDKNLSVKSQETFDAAINNGSPQPATPKNLGMRYNSLSDQFILVWSAWQERTTGTGSDSYTFEVYQRMFALQNSGAVVFRNNATLVSKPPDIVNYGSGLPDVSWSKKRNEYLLTWNKGIASGSIGNLGEGDLFWRRVSPETGGFIDSDSRFLLSLTGNQTLIDYNGKAGHFMLGWRNDGQHYISGFEIPKDLPPMISAVMPNKAAAGTPVIVTAIRMGNKPLTNRVKFGSIEAVVDSVSPVANDPTKIRVIVPSGLTREKVPVTIIYDDQQSTDANNTPVLFENISQSSVTSVLPAEGRPGDIIKITGSNFPVTKTDFQVKFGNVVAHVEDVISNTTTEINVRVPQDAVRGTNQSLSVIIQDIANDGPAFRVIRIPSIESVALTDGGNEFTSCKTIVVSGRNFSANKADLLIKFGTAEVAADAITSVSDDVIHIVIPTGLKAVMPLSVSTVDGDVTSAQELNLILGSKLRTPVQPPEFKFNKKRLDDEISLEAEVYNKCSVKELRFWSKGISEPENNYTSKIITGLTTSTSNAVKFTIKEADFTSDPLGLEGYYEAVDVSGASERSDTFKIFRDYVGSDETAAIPSLAFGGTVADYNIVAIPYDLSPNKINTVFKSILDVYGYDKSKWRIHHFNAETQEYNEYLNGLDDIDPGKGYWIIARNQQEIIFDLGKTARGLVDEPFEIVLHEGWNQIGNPYPFDVSWSDIMTASGNPTGVESFKTFRNGAFEETNTIAQYRGGFVRSNGTVTLKVPFENKNGSGGRLASRESFPGNLAEKEWRIALDLSGGKLSNRISSFGMHPRSLNETDDRDEHRLPVFVENLDLSFPGALSTSIVTTADNYSWTFEVFNTTGATDVTLTWNNQAFGENDRELFLHDKTEERLINMREHSSYTVRYTKGYQFNIHFGDRGYVDDQARPQRGTLSDAYPNPMTSVTTIPFTVTTDRTHVQLALHDLQGRVVRTLVDEELDKGFYEASWDGKGSSGEAVAAGVLIYRLQTTSGSAIRSSIKKLIVTP